MDGVHRYLRYTYDAAGNRTRVTHPDWVYFTSSYNALGRLTATYENGSYPLIRPTFDSQGRRSYVTRGGGPDATGTDRTSVVEGKSVLVRVDLGGRRPIKQKK